MDRTATAHLLLIVVRDPKKRHYVSEVSFAEASFRLGDLLGIYKNDNSPLCTIVRNNILHLRPFAVLPIYNIAVYS